MNRKTTILRNVILVSTVIVFLLTGCDPSAPNKSVSIIFRYDDYSAESNTNVEQSLIELFRQNDMPITFSVIPYVVAGNPEDQSKQALHALPREKAEILKKAEIEGVVNLAIHGYSHQTIQQRPFSEFAGLNYHSQLTRMLLGKTYIEWLVGAPVTVFVPPWNRFDRNTILAMQVLGFTTLSASTSAESFDGSKLDLLPTPCSPLKRCILSIPATCSIYFLKDCILAALEEDYQQPTIVVLVHSYDFIEGDPEKGFTSLFDFSELLHWLQEQPDIKVIPMSGLHRARNFLPENPLFSQGDR